MKDNFPLFFIKRGLGELKCDRGRLAQLVRASDLHSEGRGFNSFTAHQFSERSFL